MDGKSLNITEDKLSKLKEIIPEAFTENKIDWEKLKAAFGENIEFKNERYVLNWAGKSDAFRVLQSPTTATLVPAKEESVNFDTTENIFIEGENLEVLKVLQKAYFGKIKMIYIDPPYNTGNDNFIYPDKFSETREEYLNRIGDKDETGYLTREGLFRKNSKDSGHYHSNWLSMMYPRLFLARNLLKDDGVIFVSIDDNEVHNLRLLMNEVFGEENFITQLVWEKKKKGTFLSNSITNVKEYILVYSKNIEMFNGLIGQINSEIETYPCINASNKREIRKIPAGIKSKFKESNYKLKKGSIISVTTMDLLLHSDLVIENNVLKNDLIIEGNWRYTQDLITQYANSEELYITQDLYLRRIVKEPRYKTLKDLLPRVGNNEALSHKSINVNNLFEDGWGSNEDGEEELRMLLKEKGLIDFPKPKKLIEKLIASIRDKDAIIIDFFSGSATTAHAVLDLNKEDGGNRKFILVQLPEKTDEKSEAYKAGYKTIAEIGKERIRRVINKIKKEHGEKLDLDGNSEKLDLGFKVFKLQESNFKIWRTKIETEEELVEQLEQHLEPLEENAKTEDVLYELLLKSGVSLTANIKKKDGIYFVNNNEIALLLKKVNDKIIKLVINQKPKKVITLDRLFNNNDQLKTNTALQMKDAGIEFKVV